MQNYFETNFIKIHSAVIQILSFSCSVLFLVMANGGHLGMPNCKKIKKEKWETRNILAQSRINFNQWFLIYHHFRVYAIFSNGSLWSSWIVNLHKVEIVSLKKSKRLYTRNILAWSWINFIQWFFRYCHFRVCAIFSNSPWRPNWIVNLHKIWNDSIQGPLWLNLTKIHSCFLEILGFEGNWLVNTK